MMARLLSRIDFFGAALLAIVIAGLSIAYVASAYATSSRLHNIIFVAPIGALTVLFAAIIVLRALLRPRAKPSAGREISTPIAASEPQEASAPSEVGPLSIALMMALVLAYAGSIPYIGFDIASVVFMALCLWLQGERRIVFIGIFSVGYGLAVTWLLLHAARIPAYTLIL
jgi:putative tricarboxylic transport membrane protein